MGYLKQMFPSKGEPEISKALMDVKGDQETAFDILMGAGKDKTESFLSFLNRLLYMLLTIFQKSVCIFHFFALKTNEPLHEKTNNLHMQNKRRKSAVQ